MARRVSEQCEIDMTPMIDVVFQLIIFFVVTLKMTSDINPDIELEDGKNGVTLTQDNMPPSQLEIEVDRRGRISIHNATMSKSMLRTILTNRVAKHGNEFPCLIRADRLTPHSKVKEVMDICTERGVWKLSFVAIQEHKAQK
ncbi:MAG: biopolymer transporter ExbD [Kiritimatiellae bacterium]|nr:biopolymer transporter ExbD [Kiritimatiellia bacterium]MBP5228026.1 biopolymer transporter ExbD [Kiritimatiellia bacterium]